jgi:hypothetical protein
MLPSVLARNGSINADVENVPNFKRLQRPKTQVGAAGRSDQSRDRSWRIHRRDGVRWHPDRSHFRLKDLGNDGLMQRFIPCLDHPGSDHRTCRAIFSLGHFQAFSSRTPDKMLEITKAVVLARPAPQDDDP